MRALRARCLGAIGDVSVLTLLDFRGRSSRRAWWVVVLSVAVVEAGMSIWLTGEPFPLNPQLPTETRATGGLIHLAAMWPVVAVSVRRAHDLNSSGWPVIGLWTVSVLGGLAFAFLNDWTRVAASVAGVAAQFWIAFGLGLGTRTGEDGSVGGSAPSRAEA